MKARPIAMNHGIQVYFATVLLELNRWTPAKVPTFKVSEWAGAIREAGFAGLELWENHAALADADEQAALTRLPLPVPVFNSYCTFDDRGAAGRKAAAAFVKRFGCGAVKFNFGNDRAKIAEYVRNLDAWTRELPHGCRLLCECHGGTVLETPDGARRVLEPLAGRVEIIVHAFAGERETLRRWLDLFGPAVTHVHAAGRVGQGPMLRLDDIADEAQARADLMKKAGFCGSWTIEFTRGVARPPEDRRALLANAAADLMLLRKIWE